MRPGSKPHPFTSTLADLPGWEARSGGNSLRGQWRFRRQGPAAVFVWAVILRAFRHELLPNVTLWNTWVTVEINQLRRPERNEKALALAADLSTITGPPGPEPIDQPSPFLDDITRTLRAELIISQLKDYLDAREPK